MANLSASGQRVSNEPVRASIVPQRTGRFFDSAQWRDRLKTCVAG